jgi:hypothetical protein
MGNINPSAESICAMLSDALGQAKSRGETAMKAAAGVSSPGLKPVVGAQGRPAAPCSRTSDGG